MKSDTHYMRLLTILFLLATGCVSFSQKISMYRTFGGVRFETDTLILSINQVLDSLKENEEAYSELRKAKAKHNVAGVLGFAGGFLAGFSLGSVLGGGTPEWGLTAAGAGLILVSIPFDRAFKRHAQHALDTYNTKFASTRWKTDVYFTGSGAKLVFRF